MTVVSRKWQSSDLNSLFFWHNENWARKWVWTGELCEWPEIHTYISVLSIHFQPSASPLGYSSLCYCSYQYEWKASVPILSISMQCAPSFSWNSFNPKYLWIAWDTYPSATLITSVNITAESPTPRPPSTLRLNSSASERACINLWFLYVLVCTVQCAPTVCGVCGDNQNQNGVHGVSLDKPREKKTTPAIESHAHQFRIVLVCLLKRGKNGKFKNPPVKLALER